MLAVSVSIVFSKAIDVLFDKRGDHVAQTVGITDNQRLYFHGRSGILPQAVNLFIHVSNSKIVADIQPSMLVAEKLGRQNMKTFFAEWASCLYLRMRNESNLS